VELAGIVRYMKWDDLNATPARDLSGDATGWGFNLSSNIKAGADNLLRLQAVTGAGIENYMNDAPVDVGIETNPGNAISPIKGKALPLFGGVAFLEHNWNEKYSTCVGYSIIDIDNSDGQAPDAFKKGQYALVNLLYTPVKNATMGVEFQWGSRDNFSDGWNTTIEKIQLGFKYNFSQIFYR
jgi:hypothetical protein